MGEERSVLGHSAGPSWFYSLSKGYTRWCMQDFVWLGGNSKDMLRCDEFKLSLPQLALFSFPPYLNRSSHHWGISEMRSRLSPIVILFHSSCKSRFNSSNSLHTLYRTLILNHIPTSLDWVQIGQLRRGMIQGILWSFLYCFARFFLSPRVRFIINFPISSKACTSVS